MSSKPAAADGSRRGSRAKPKSPKPPITLSSPNTIAAAVTKKRYSKTKLGCKTCKVRKIRCDETSPVCNNCIKSGRRCDGVAEPANKDGGLTFTAPLTLTHFRPTQTGWLTPREVAHLDLFRHELVYSIVGHVGTPAWRRLILQAVHEEVALCHAVVAFTALSTSGDAGCDAGLATTSSVAAQSPPQNASRENEFALRHYGKALEAMRHVFRHDDKRSINTALLCTLLCICFELRIREPATALTHLEHGLQVVNSNLHTVDEAITTAFARLDLQAAIFLGIRPPALDPSRVASRIFVFDSVYQEADNALAGLTNRVWTFIRTVADDYRYEDPPQQAVPDAVAARARDIQHSLAGFRMHYLTAGSGSKLDKMLPEQVSLLRIKYLTCVIVMSGCLAREETAAYDAHAADFVAVVDLAADIRARQQQLIPSHATGGTGSFQLDMAVIQPLYLTATKCRCPVTRRRAVRALRAGPDFEGAWEAAVNARIAERVIQMEEEGLAFDLESLRDGELVDVPESVRVHAVDICAEPAQGRATVYFSRRPNGPGTEWEDLQEEITW
ncbi:Zn(2)-C6 fungal-type DNA-binding domain protein [Cordyceps fumosorosea ARSEF 2679]|uniref:Zn(2)-C6 fungal-type DNA-binding domain protein n=1 Tax=Cordyceps fumosorosea (strain ARSEF 2679) TaxID=1081104 RepID=A0A167MQI3_CORFA|nr:Zn(2)-C6 fungal-type DNA-binding domain protein [Cordyceps fumosorosea ARSEF 2679]OAA54647.1 Zn(2)-C6 fungal-type DNA-binding domain protein [Cordyceps fumosorosea ARSEF 2679]